MTPIALTELQWRTLMDQDRILALVREECARQLAHWDRCDHPPVVWLGIVTEQVGQAATAILSLHPERDAETEKQLIHVAAVCISAIESLRRRDGLHTMSGANTAAPDPNKRS